ncbi:sugar transferase [Georgenia ruanii]|uniref:Exopolysaccharide biosynthesis polyprenyl glycosylphosphotransferase n=1 Tax=Georgenia ruanii TaxID=348442 RepID=A0A7J9USA2_9MICO|nr:sugar transferase [Georgenia ruanii]MPV87496.1 exopolysaccharide biosynthesis polyprenyl glycosylphosphotransferase [Georgenia ruanii]
MAVTVAGTPIGLPTRSADGATAGRRAAPPPARRAGTSRGVVAGADLILAAVAVVLATRGVAPAVEAALAAAAGGALVALVAAHHGYARRAAGHGAGDYRAVVRGGTAWAAAVLALVVATGAGTPGPTLPAALAATVGGLLAVRVVDRAVLRRRRRQGRLTRPALVVGPPEHLPDLLAALGSAEDGLDAIGACTTAGPGAAGGLPVLGPPDAAAAVAGAVGAEAVVASAALGADQLRRLSWALAGRGVELLVAPHLLEVGAARVEVRPVGATALLAVRVDVPRAHHLVKAAADRVVGALLLAASAVVLVPAALAVRLTSPGPVFYRQTRIGLGGRPFTMYKLRSMTTDADRRRAELAERSDGNGTLFKMRQDPRVTPVGRVLRRYSIDELPQLLNVVRGEMSLVGPRPPLPAETATYDDVVRRRLLVKPGLTGLWQVSGRSDLDWEQSVRLDLRYVDNWSVPMDLAILGRTAGAVLGARGAY